MRMKVLHVWNTAGVASTLAKYQSKILGWRTWVLTRKVYDKYGFTTYGKAMTLPNTIFKLILLYTIRNYDIIHVHSLDELLPKIKDLYPNKPVILHYHGSEIRNKWSLRKRYWKLADVIIVSTKDLLESAPQERVYYLPNPVDTEIFKPILSIRIKNTALFIYDNHPKYKASLEWAKSIAKKKRLKLIVHNRAVKPIKFLDLPLFLNRFEYFIDHKWTPALSKTALEALACNVKVIRWDGKVIENLPSQHKPENVIKALIKIYKEVIRTKDVSIIDSKYG